MISGKVKNSTLVGNTYLSSFRMLIQFLGDGIFNVDGHTWSDARALLRPQFHKQLVSDLHVFEDHITKLISLLPKDGRTIDLLDWWFRFTLDASTDYLFGESVESILNPRVCFLCSG
jgi:cytochrome P450